MTFPHICLTHLAKLAHGNLASVGSLLHLCMHLARNLVVRQGLLWLLTLKELVSDQGLSISDWLFVESGGYKVLSDVVLCCLSELRFQRHSQWWFVEHLQVVSVKLLKFELIYLFLPS